MKPLKLKVQAITVRWFQQLRAVNPKPPLLGEVARRSRDGEVCGLCHAGILGFFPGLEAQPIAATPQALRASSTHKGMATHTQLKLRFAAHLAGEPLRAHPQGDGDSHAAEAAVRCAPSRGAFKNPIPKEMPTHT